MDIDRLKHLAGVLLTENIDTQPNEQEIRRAAATITHQTDGPVTAFVILTRAMEEAKRTGKDYLYANAAYEALVDHGFMRDHEADRQNAPAVNTADR